MTDRKKLRIAVCDLVTSVGGVQRVMSNVLPRIAEQFDIYVVDPYANEDYAKMLRGANVTLYFTEPTFKKTFIGNAGTWKRLPSLILAGPRLLRMRSMFIKAISEINPDCIYTNQVSTLRLLRTVGHLCDISLMYHSHGYTEIPSISFSCVRFINHRVSRVIAVSRSVAEALRRAGVRCDITNVCYNGVSIEEIERCAKLSVNKPLPDRQPDEVIFLVPASIQFNKGQHITLAALAKAIQKGCKAVLWFAGDEPTGADKQYLTQLRNTADKLGIGHLVHFLGHRDDIYQVMHAADVVVLPSLDEGLPMCLIEAMSIGLPVIATAVGGIGEIVVDNETGLLFKAGSADELANAMRLLASDAEMRENLGEAGRKRAEELFQIFTQADKISAIISATAGLCASSTKNSKLKTF